MNTDFDIVLLEKEKIMNIINVITPVVLVDYYHQRGLRQPNS